MSGFHQFGYKLLEKENEFLPFKKKALVSECDATHWKENMCMFRTQAIKRYLKEKKNYIQPAKGLKHCKHDLMHLQLKLVVTALDR